LDALILAEGPETIAAMIAEPVMGAGGVIVPPKTYFSKIKSVLSKYEILLLSDEVVCGFGRTGKWFGSQTFDFVPDMMSVAKGLSSGYMPIAAAVISDAVYQTVANEADRIGVFGHGFTYSGHPVASAVAAEVLRMYKEMNAPAVAKSLGTQLHNSLNEQLVQNKLVGDIRGEGLIAGVEIVKDKNSRERFDPLRKVGSMVERQCRARGVMIRNMGDTLAICPPFVIRSAEIDALVSGISGALEAVAHEISNCG
jgi:4-aminobutyrate---pyruvate transaminase